MEITYNLENPAELVKSAKSKLADAQDITYDECVALFAHYCKRAIHFFQLDPAWNISLNPDSKEDSASVTFTARYLNADIYFNPEYFRQFPLEIKKAASHEIAHIFLGKYMASSSSFLRNTRRIHIPSTSTIRTRMRRPPLEWSVYLINITQRTDLFS